MWRRDGKELFYIVPSSGMLMSAETKTSSQFEASVPKMLFQVLINPAPDLHTGNHYAVSADGQRFLVLLPVQEYASLPFTVVLNWFEELKRKVPAK